MRTHLIGILLIAGLAATTTVVAAAPGDPTTAPAPNAKSAPGGDSMHVTVTAGRGRLGVQVIQISPELRVHLGGPEDKGVIVDRVQAVSPAARAGVRVGDLIVEVGGTATSSARDMLSAMSDRKRGDKVEIVVLRDGQPHTLAATMEDDPGVARRGGGGLPGRFESFEWDLDGIPWMKPGDGSMRRMHEDMRQRMDAIEKRLRALERI